MGRTIITKARFAEVQSDDATGQAPDNYASQIVKLIPIEIVGVYLGISNLIKGQDLVQWIIFLIILIITPFYLKKVANISDRIQIIIATISYIIWAISLGGPFENFLQPKLPPNFTVQTLGGILIMLYTLIVPIFYRPAKA
ncbi:hypothetical protein FAM09_03390 [Niastella caeni]|uniref:Uncharacterized protein n=1 Tax=Niastella caeni TaxID=2569763 RepID=A0A4S8HZQ0_9BACT|nr:hypothetical protein [Niastella caeni]THU41170.1 hypothetical protein FAM09_03390 [Niastella caeni]